MCGIAGIMMYPKNRTEQELEFIRELASELAVENQRRGTHATGIATFGEDGYDVLKHNISAEELTVYDTWIDFCQKNISNKTHNILIHTRHATQGSPDNNDNNHPIVTATNIGIHNGMLYNDGSLFKTEGLYRQAQVDSEVIFRLVDKELANDKDNAKNVAEKISGVFAVAYVKKNETNKLNYFRNSNPTTFAYIPSLNIVVFASLKEYIVNALNTAFQSCAYTIRYTADLAKVDYFEPKRDIVMQFDVLKNTPVAQLHQEPLKFDENYDYGSWYDEQDWYYQSFRNRTSGTGIQSTAYGYDTEVDTESITNIYDFIEQKGLQYLMSDDDYTQMIELLDLNEKNEWSKGYTSGRQSTENDIKVIREQVEELQAKQKLAN